MAQADKVPVNTLNSCTLTFACGCPFSVAASGTTTFAACGTGTKNHRTQEEAMRLGRQVQQKLHEFQNNTGN